MNRTTRNRRPVTLGEAARSEPRTAPADPEPFATPDPGRPGVPPPGETVDVWAPPRGRPAATGEPGGTVGPSYSGDTEPADLADLAEPVGPHPLSRLLVVIAAGLLGVDLVVGSGPLPLRLAAVVAAGACGVLLWRSLDTARRRHAMLAAELTETEVDADARQVAVAGLFVNLARRSQSLVDRQLSLIGVMEQSEHRPEALGELFQLDHLATRIRRHAESLLVLAGDESPSRSWRRPVPLSEVARAAAAEVEEYRRVDVLVAENVQVAGRAVADLAHLLAELIENATTYSPAERRVQVRSHAEPSGDAHRPAIVVAVEDNGMGMADADIEAVNRVLAEPLLLDLRGHTMGMHVVSRLARRYGLTVRLGPTAGGGVTALVTLPAELVTESDPARPALPPASSAGPTFDPLLAAGTSVPPALPPAPAARPAPNRPAATPTRRAAPAPPPAGPASPARHPAPAPSSSDATWTDPARRPPAPPSDAAAVAADAEGDGILSSPIALPGPGHPGNAPAPDPAAGAHGEVGPRGPAGRDTFVAPVPDDTLSGAPGSSARSAGRDTYTPATGAPASPAADTAGRGTFTPGTLGPATPVGAAGVFGDPAAPERTDLFPPPVATPGGDDEVISLPSPGDIGPASGPPTSTKDREHVRSMLSRFQASQRAGRALADAPPGSLAPASPTAATATPHPVPQEDS